MRSKHDDTSGQAGKRRISEGTMGEYVCLGAR